MLSEQWVNASQADELVELRELVHLALDPKFAPFLQLPAGTVSPDGSSIVGRSGHLFVNDGSNKWREQLRGAITIESEALARTIEYLTECYRRISSAGKQFRFVVVPEKDVIYPDLSPNAKGKVSDARPIHRVMSEMNIFTVYPVNELTSYTDAVRTFHVRNSHVSFFGGVIIANSILRSLDRQELDFERIQTEFVYWPDDLSIKWVDGLNTRRRILKQRFEIEEVAKVEGHVGTHLIFRNEFARTQENLIIFGDSYSWNPDAGLARLLSFEFYTVHFIWRKAVDWILVDNAEPSTVLVQTAERFLIKGLYQ